ncbi:MAG: polysaccharide deacetylase family protein [Nocardioides sp.]|uniref:polysaccharide deacetylase family protein n=1 Tax=Nocardioides sp. TaxID=35761 RepID=UPI0039E5096E
MTAATALSYSAHHDAVAGGRFIRVVNYHNTPHASRDALCQELRTFGTRFDSIGLDELDRFFETGSWGTDRPGFLPVFYEGYRNSAEVAGPVCDELGITGWFPVCTGFVDSPVPEQEAYARSHHIGLVAEDLANRGQRLAMTWEEITDLSRRHVVTPHTASHYGINDVATDEELEREIVEPKRLMDAVTGQSAPAFVWLHGTPWGMSARHDDAVRAAGYRYLISNTMIHRIG